MIKLKEIMFPLSFSREKRKQPGSCMLAAEHTTHFLLSKGIKKFKVIEGYVSFSSEDDDSAHTWLEINGRVFDPTKKQFEKWNFNVNNMIYLQKNRTEYSPEEYLDLCREHASTFS